MKKHFAFTMAEILLSLTIIGVVAAITLPSLTGNINERTWNTQRKALYACMSQAISLMPSLNNYGSDSNATQIFLTNGLAKVLKINNICDHEHLKDCGITDKITCMDGLKISVKTNLKEWNTSFQNISIDTYAAAFETANGESILAYYNPNCTPDHPFPRAYYSYTLYEVIPFMCANFIYDLNGSKGPNTVGKDIGFITAMYATDSKVVSPMPSASKNANNNGRTSWTGAMKACKNENPYSRVPNIDELTAMFYNRELINVNPLEEAYWSSSSYSKTEAYVLHNLLYLTKVAMPKSSSPGSRVRCIWR